MEYLWILHLHFGKRLHTLAPNLVFPCVFFRVCYHKDHRVGVNHFGGCLFEQRQQSFGGTQLGMVIGGWWIGAMMRHAIGRNRPEDCVSSNTTEPLHVARCFLAKPSSPRCLLIYYIEE